MLIKVVHSVSERERGVYMYVREGEREGREKESREESKTQYKIHTCTCTRSTWKLTTGSSTGSRLDI
jgi:hypothetical protein